MSYRIALGLLLLLLPATRAAADELADLRMLPVLQDGRIKPFDSAARAVVREVSNAATLDGRDPVALALDWAARPWNWENKPIIYVGPPELRKALGVPATQARVSPATLRDNETLKSLSAGNDALHQAAVDLRDRLAAFDAAGSGRDYAMVAGSSVTDAWQTPAAAAGEFAKPWRAALHAFDAGDTAAMTAAFAELRGQLNRAAAIGASGALFDPSAFRREIFYNRVEPFRISAIIYLVALLALLPALPGFRQRRARFGGPDSGAHVEIGIARATPPLSLFKRGAFWIGSSILGLALATNIVGFVLRCSITGWAPVTNLYETIIWVAAVLTAIALGFSLATRRRDWRRSTLAAVCGAAGGLLAATVAASLPPDYGAAFKPLPLALRTNFWLSIHVLTIVSSYGAFSLAMIAANIVLVASLARRTVSSSSILLVDRAVQIGTTLAIAGTLLGGLWAEMAWGRFWGWDPKEVWALIIILAYLTLLHARLTRRVGDFGMAVGAAGCFAAVLMSWYGVNFILAAGLHSYGFVPGGAGRWLIGGYLIAQILLLGIVAIRRVPAHPVDAFDVDAAAAVTVR